jgi:hypothetical protein
VAKFVKKTPAPEPEAEPEFVFDPVETESEPEIDSEELQTEEPASAAPETSAPLEAFMKSLENAPAAPDKPDETDNVRKVRVATVVNHHCKIGPTMYHFQKNVPQMVPVEVKEILRQANLLAPL